MRKANLCFLCLLLAFAMIPGCAFKRLSNLPAEDQAVEYSNMMLSAYNATHFAYLEAVPNFNATHRKKAVPFVQAMNIAKPSVVLLAKSAEAWKTAADSQNATLTEDARIVYRDQKAIFAEIWAKALDLWAKIKRQE